MRLTITYLFLGATLLVLLALIFVAGDFGYALQMLLALCVLILGVLPIFVAKFNRRERLLIPLMPLHGIFYAVGFSLPVFFTGLNWFSASQDSVIKALMLTMFGLMMMLCGYYGFWKITSKIRPLSIGKKFSSKVQLQLAWVLVSIYLMYQLLPALSELPSLPTLIDPIGHVGIGILFILSLDRKISGFQRLLVLFSCLFMGYQKFFSTSLMLVPGILFVAFLGVLYWNQKQNVPKKLIALALSIIIILTPVKAMYRLVMDFDFNGIGQVSMFEKARLMTDVLIVYSEGSSSLLELLSKGDAIVSRLGQTPLFSNAVQLTPEKVPYLMGETYLPLASKFIPRVFWPSKPSDEVGHMYGHRYYILHPTDDTTSQNLPWIVEMYINFGNFGVLIGMFMVGILFRLLAQYFSAEKNNYVASAMGTSLIISLFYAESNFSQMIGGVILSFFSLYILTLGLAAFLERYGQKLVLKWEK